MFIHNSYHVVQREKKVREPKSKEPKEKQLPENPQLRHPVGTENDPIR
jgi:hypothetical protein